MNKTSSKLPGGSNDSVLGVTQIIYEQDNIYIYIYTKDLLSA